jgi:hypothetical protein
VGDPSTGYLYKTTISDLKTLTGAGVVSFNGRFGTVNPAEGDYTLTQLGDVIITSVTNGQVLQYNGSNWVNTTLPTEADTLDTVTGRGNTTSNSITVGSVTAAGLSNLVGQIRTFATTGNTYIGANPTSATDAGFKLDVNGTARIGSNPADVQLTINGRTTAVGAIFMQDYLSFTGTNKIIYTNDLTFNTNNALTNGTATRYLFTQAVPLANTGTGTVDLVKILMPVNTGSGSNVTSRGLVIDFSVTTNAGTLVAIDAMQGTVRLRDLAGTGSRMVVADANGVLSAQAIPDLSGYVTLDSFQTITASKTFSVGFSLASAGGSNQLTSFANTNSIHSGSGGSNIFGFNSSNNIYFGKGLSNGGVIGWNNSAVRSYTLPDATGTLALTSDIPSLTNYVTLDGTQTITGLKTFSGLLTANGNIKATYYGFADSNGYSTGFESTSNNTIQVKIGSGLAINIASNNNTTFYGNIIRNGGTSSQFLKADGSLDSSTYATTSSLSSYLPLSGGTLTGGLNGTTASFSGYVTATGLFAYYLLGRSSDNYGAFWFGSNNGATRYGYIQSGSDNGGQVVLNGDGGGSITLDNRGMNVTGAATFSSSVTAGTQFIGNNSITDPTAGITTGTVFALNGASSNNTFGIGVAAVRNGNYDIWFQTGSINGGGYRFYKGTSEIVTITSAGELLVGTTSRVTGLSGFTQLEVSGSEGGITINSNTTTTDKFSRLMFTKGGATGNEGLIRYNVNDYHMAFFTNAAERMRITSDGKVNIDNMLRVASDLTSGKINIGALLNSGFNGITIQTYQSPASGNFIEFLNLSGNSAGNITHTGTTTVAYNTSSDYRLKEDLKDFNGIDKIKAINVYDFKWKEEENRMFGVLAHELKEVLPYAVSGEKDAVYEDGRIKSQGVDYSFLTPLLVKAIQEQQAQIESLKARLK